VHPDLWSRGNLTPRLLWDYQPRLAVATPARPRLTPLTDRGPRNFRPKSKSKRERDRLRSVQRDRVFEERRQERMRLFGFVRLKTGDIISLDEATKRLNLSLKGDVIEGLGKDQIVEWHQPEAITDVTNSIGEVDATAYYPALDIFPGVVLRDPKIGHKDPALTW
jgi:hypothetical protein